MKLGRLALFGVLMVVLLLIPSMAFAVPDYSNGGLHYNINTGTHTVYVSDADDSMGTITVPASVTFQGPGDTIPMVYAVTGIGEDAFNNNTMTGISLPTSLRTIGEEAFYSCDGLTSITIPAGVMRIDPYAIAYCSALTTAVLPSTALDLGTHLFRNDTALTSVTLPAGLVHLPNAIFYDCDALEMVTLPSTLKTINRAAFLDSGLTGITIPSSVWYIGDRVFENCDDLVGSATSGVIIPSSVTYTGSNLFEDCDDLLKVTNRSRVRTLGYRMFADCDKLASVNIPSTVQVIGGEAFDNCDGLTSMKIPNTVIRFDTPTENGNSYAFDDCDSLVKITFGSGTKVIPGWTVTDCTALKVIVVPTGVEYIDGGAFHGNSALRVISLPSTTKFVGPDAFGDSSSLISVRFFTAAPPKTSLYTFQGVNPNMVVHAPAGGWAGITKLRDYEVKHDLGLLKFDTNGGKNAAKNIPRVLLPFAPGSPTRSGYVFKGWYHHADFSGPRYTTLTTSNVTHVPFRLYAKWAKK